MYRFCAGGYFHVVTHPRTVWEADAWKADAWRRLHRDCLEIWQLVDIQNLHYDVMHCKHIGNNAYYLGNPDLLD